MGTFDNRRVLVIDDEPSIHADFRSVLAVAPLPAAELRLQQLSDSVFGTPRRERRAGFDVASAHQGREGADAAAAALKAGRPFAAAFVDMRMPPGWDGLQTVRELWRVDPALHVAFCTAYSDYAWEDTLGQLDGLDRLLVIKKPFDPIEVWQIAHVLCAKWSQSRELETLRAGRTSAAAG